MPWDEVGQGRFEITTHAYRFHRLIQSILAGRSNLAHMRTMILNHAADNSKSSQLGMQAAFADRCQHPFTEVGEWFPVLPARNTQQENAILGKCPLSE
jgi:hypothetical protein